jgi:hypothetical protein
VSNVGSMGNAGCCDARGGAASDRVGRLRAAIAHGAVVVLLALTATADVRVDAADSQPAPQQQDEFVPISELPPQDRMPAAPLLIGAYVFVLAVLFLYVLSVARRLTALQRDVARLEGDLAKRART